MAFTVSRMEEITPLFTDLSINIDHVGGGFHRYSTDKHWHVPHFEKMLYDQAQLLSTYASAYQITRDPLFAATAKDIIGYVARDLRHPEGGFYSAEDADSLPVVDAKSKLGKLSLHGHHSPPPALDFSHIFSLIL